MKKDNFVLKKLKITNSGLAMTYNEKVVIGEVASEIMHSVTSKDEVHPDMKTALQAFQDVVRYDEGYSEEAEIKITGITVFPDLKMLIISHNKKIISGNTNRNSGRIHFESEDFEKAAECENIYKTLQTEAFEFIAKNKRAQLELAFEGDQEGKS